MAKFLQQLLDSREPLFNSSLHRLEAASGRSAVDVRLIADITHKAHEIMRSLGLDTADTTSKELYMALNSYIKSNSDGSLLYDSDYVLISIDNQVVSFNLIDIIENFHHELSFNERNLSHARRSLRGEIVNRYVDHGRTDETAVRNIAEDAGLLPDSDLGHADYRQLRIDEQIDHKEEETK